MKVTFADTFYESLETMRRHNTRWYRIYQTFRYDIPRFIKTIWMFRKELYTYHVWDNSYPMDLLRRGIELTADHMDEFGSEVRTTRVKKIKAMRRTVELLDHHVNGSFLELAEIELGFEYNTTRSFDDEAPEQPEVKAANRLISDRSDTMEAETWIELMDLLKGQDIDELRNAKPDEHATYDEWFDGSGLRQWWD